MEYIHGKKTAHLDGTFIVARLGGYHEILVDIGTGDGRFVQYMARENPSSFIIGVDSCRENLRQVSRQSLPNSLYLIANAESLPAELKGLAKQVTVNFPWGSLLNGLLQADSPVIHNLREIMQPDAELHIRLNGGALQKAGYTLPAGAQQIQHALLLNDFRLKRAQPIETATLRAFPSTWARRLSYGPMPGGIFLSFNIRQ